MQKEIAAGVFGPYGAVVNEKTFADAHYHAAITQRNLDIASWTPFCDALELAVAHLTRHWGVSPLARTVAELAELGGRQK